VLLAAGLEPRERQHVADMRSAARLLLGSIDDVLDLSKLEAGQMTVLPVPFALMPLIDDVIVQSQALIGAKPLRLEADIGADVPENLVDDRQKIAQILLNLTSNAVKFTPRGGLRLRVRLHEGRLRFHVADTGPGIAADRREAVFDPFTQIDTSPAGAASSSWSCRCAPPLRNPAPPLGPARSASGFPPALPPGSAGWARGSGCPRMELSGS
jgi:signal transduction histidine kinase